MRKGIYFSGPSNYRNSLFNQTAALGAYTLQATPLVLLYGLVSLGPDRTILSFVGLLIVFLSGILDWAASGLTKHEGLLCLGLVVTVTAVHTVAAALTDPILALAFPLGVANFVLDPFERSVPYRNIGKRYWPFSVVLVPIAIPGLLVLFIPAAFPSSLTYVYTKIQEVAEKVSDDASNSEERSASQVQQFDNPKEASPDRIEPNSGLDSLQRSETTVEDITSRRPDDDRE